MSEKTFTGVRRTRRTRTSVKVAEVLSRALITIGGIGTVVAVVGICVFLVWVVIPLFTGGDVEETGRIAVGEPGTSERPVFDIDDYVTRMVDGRLWVFRRGSSELERFLADGDLAIRVRLPKGGPGGITLLGPDRETLDEFIAAKSRPVRVGIDEYRVMSWVLFGDGAFESFHMGGAGQPGGLLEKRSLFDGKVPSAVAFAEGSDDVVFGFEDGTIVLGTLGFATSFFDADTFPGGALPADLVGMAEGDVRPYDGGMIQMTPEGQYRLQKLTADLGEPTRLKPPSPVRKIDLTMKGENNPIVAALTDDGRIVINEVRKRKNLLTGKVTIKLVGGEITLDESQRGVPKFLGLSGLGDLLYLVWEDGQLVRYNTRNLKEPVLAEKVSLLHDGASGTRVTAFRFMNGKSTFVVGDSTGMTRAWFPVNPESPETLDGTSLVMAHELPGPGAAVTAFGPSIRTRLLTVGYADGSALLFHTTTHALVSEADTEGGGILLAVDLAPKEDGIVAATPNAVVSWELDADHPDITLKSLFFPVWYEGYEGPEHVWQSTGGTDDFEPKLGMIPLVFGTLKGTIYSMLFALPLALLAAIFASEFMHPRVKSKVKPTVEVMASLPSVVLGFLAALVIAPFVEDFVPACLACFFTVPLAFLLGAYAWQLLPQDTVIRHSGWRFPLMCACVPVGILLGALLGPGLESVLFAGDIKMWLDGQVGSGIGGWIYILLPLSVIIAATITLRFLAPLLSRLTQNWGRRACAWFDLVRFGGTGFLALVIAVLLAAVLALAGLDPRGSVLDTYVQRNALVVGFIMGFAIIPIIFTIAEDALSAVPEHLRSASLGAGATPWQTATRIIVPTAASGLFSAVMIGLGRAVGETMIVLMAAGNTPIMDMNIFNGFRTLSANLAVELPEAPIGGTHYRTLFLAALVLFLLTFILNTIAETVRLRFRKRAFEL